MCLHQTSGIFGGKQITHENTLGRNNITFPGNAKIILSRHFQAVRFLINFIAVRFVTFLNYLYFSKICVYQDDLADNLDWSSRISLHDCMASEIIGPQIHVHQLVCLIEHHPRKITGDREGALIAFKIELISFETMLKQAIKLFYLQLQLWKS